MIENKIILDGTINLTFIDDGEENFDKRSTPHNTHCFIKDNAPNEAGAFKYILSLVEKDKIKTMLDIFSGTGWTSSIAVKYLNLETLDLMELSKNCCKSLTENFKDVIEPKIRIFNKNVYEYIVTKEKNYDMIYIGNNKFTLKDYKDDILIKNMIKWSFAHSNKYVSLVDSTLYGGIRFENVRNYYEKLFNIKLDEDFDKYYISFNEFTKKKFGFGIRTVSKFKNMRCVTILFEKGYTGEMDIHKPLESMDVKRGL